MKRTRRPFLSLASCVLLPVTAVLVFEPADEVAPAPLASTAELAVATERVEDSEFTVDRFFIGQGGTLAAACDKLGLEPEIRRVVLETAERHLDLRRLSPRSGVAVRRDAGGRPVSLSLRSSPDRFLRITLPSERHAPRAELLPLAVQTRVQTTGGVVSSSVAQALGHTAHSHTLTQAYADIFQWDVDLLVDRDRAMKSGWSTKSKPSAPYPPIYRASATPRRNRENSSRSAVFSPPPTADRWPTRPRSGSTTAVRGATTTTTAAARCARASCAAR